MTPHYVCDTGAMRIYDREHILMYAVLIYAVDCTT